ncbi:MAG: hypothetical protein CMJ35_07680 [Phycisphaerae bacterium]|nr:hypothetical protein [Phycisphaerae bacterium]MBM91481.1 hypothetical protein [Phycisphaerae bacterium]HCT44114.1 hypothetical protein [Phycisphaerales bacterium]
MTQRKTHNQHRAAFTIVEMLVVIGILVVVAVGVATIFGSVGETVARGRKLSELNQFAARIERVMRQDFENMTREGFLVIINKNAAEGEDVLLYRGEETDHDGNGVEGRPRRSDEIMFFARGVFETQRRAIAANMRASSNEAAIYYGHGQKRAPDLANFTQDSNYFFNPQPWDNNYDLSLDTRLGVENIGFVNPNEFARDWSLIRHVTLLANPSGVGQQVPGELFGFDSDNTVQRQLLLDSPRQIALQPASRSIFKSLTGSLRRDPNTNDLINRSLYDIVLQGQTQSASYYPLNLRTSGLVDIVTQDLAAIRTELMALSTLDSPSDYFDYSAVFEAPANAGLQSGFTTRDTFEEDFYRTPTDLPSPVSAMNLDLGRYDSNTGDWIAGQADHTRQIRQWMIDALPSAWRTNPGSPVVTAGDFFGGVRYEEIPTRILYNEDEFDDDDRGALERAYAEANQEMLGASVFVPRCTEFIVEWSFGFVNNTAAVNSDPLDPRFKRLEWYGLERRVDSNMDGILDGADEIAAQRYQQRDPTAAGSDPDNVARPLGPSRLLITGNSAITGTFSDVESACFGFSTQPGAASAGGVVEGTYWPWPKLIRITMTLGDPIDRDVEETYQVIFEVPAPE